MLETNDLRFFLTLSRANSLAAAARSQGVSPPAVSQRLALMEERLGLKLIERGHGRLLLTSDGEILASRAADIIDELDELVEDLADRQGRITGELKVVAPFGFGRHHVAPLMASFLSLHPNCTLNLVLSEDPYGALRKSTWDVLIHVGRLPDLDIVQRRLAPNRRVLCASPAYLAKSGALDSPQDLAHHRCGIVREDNADVTLWSLADARGNKKAVRLQPSFTSNDGEVIRSWALDGLGIVERSEWSIEGDLRAGRLVEILPGWVLPDADVIALLNPRTLRAARIQAFVDHLGRAMSTPPWRAER
jgi:DNA-binding transcriptional LysR family regulator